MTGEARPGGPSGSCYAVLFTSTLTGEAGSDYRLMAERMIELAREQDGFLGVESARGEDGLGITVSYWRDLEAVKAFRAVAEHRAAQRLGRERWYQTYRLRVARVETDVTFDRDREDGE